MVFSDLTFIYVFLPLTLAVYYAVPFRFKNAVLFLSGVLFYSWGEPMYVAVMMLSTLIDYCAGRVLHRFDDNQKIRKAALLVSVIMNLSLLGVFKYGNFAVESFNSITGLAIPSPNLPLPIGISFFTFQSMSYTIDLYRRNIKVQKSLVDFAAFVTMFPQIVAGPIVRYNDIAVQLEKRNVNFEALDDGIRIFLCGLAKKVLIANSIGGLWDTVKASEYSSLPIATAWLGILAFTFQIYFDFSGYSDMAVGMGKALGFDFPANFDYPYLSKSVSEFWRKWHMTLGNWFKSYVYIPLGGNRRGKGRTLVNLMIVWMLTGLWHGASLNFILWGTYYGALLVIERLITEERLSKLPVHLRHLLTMLAVISGWVIFEIALPADQVSFIGALLGSSHTLFDFATLNMLNDYWVVFAVAAIGATTLPKKLTVWAKARFPRVATVIVPAVHIAVLLLCTAYLVTADYNPFLYFNF